MPTISHINIPMNQDLEPRYTYLYTTSTEFIDSNVRAILKRHHFQDDKGGFHIKESLTCHNQ